MMDSAGKPYTDSDSANQDGAGSKRHASLLYSLVNKPETASLPDSRTGAEQYGTTAQTGTRHRLLTSQHSDPGTGQGQGQSQKTQNLHEFVEKEKKLRELLLGKIQTCITRKEQEKEAVSKACLESTTTTKPKSYCQPVKPALIRPLPVEHAQTQRTAAAPTSGSPLKKVKVTGHRGEGQRPQVMVASSQQACSNASTAVNAAKDQDTDRKPDPSSLCGSSRWQHKPASNTTDSGSSLLEEVLAEKKLLLMQSPEVMQWLQSQQLLVRDTKLLTVPTMPVSESPDYTGLAAAALSQTARLSQLEDASDIAGVSGMADGRHYDLPLDLAQAEGQGHDPEQQSRTGIWSREASAFMSVSRRGNTESTL